MRQKIFIGILFVTFIAVFPEFTYGQVFISGVIVDKETQDSLPGVSILEKGTNKGTASNMDGSFSLEVANNSSILQIRYVGYKPQDIKVANTGIEIPAEHIDNIFKRFYQIDTPENIRNRGFRYWFIAFQRVGNCAPWSNLR